VDRTESEEENGNQPKKEEKEEEEEYEEEQKKVVEEDLTTGWKRLEFQKKETTYQKEITLEEESLERGEWRGGDGITISKRGRRKKAR